MEKKFKKIGKKNVHKDQEGKAKDISMMTFLKVDSHSKNKDNSRTKTRNSLESNNSDMISIFDTTNIRKKVGFCEGNEIKKRISPEVNDEKKIKMIHELIAEMEHENKDRKKRSQESFDSVHFGKVMDGIDKEK